MCSSSHVTYQILHSIFDHMTYQMGRLVVDSVTCHKVVVDVWCVLILLTVGCSCIQK